MNNTISAKSLTPLVFLCLACDIVLPTTKADPVSANVRVCAILLCALLSAAIILFINLNFNLDFCNKYIKIIFAIVFLVFSCEGFVRMQAFYSFVNGDSLPILVLIILSLCVFLMAISSRRGAISRGAGIVIWVFLVSCAILIGANIINMRTVNLVNASFNIKLIFNEFIYGFRFAPELLFIPLFSASSKREKSKSTLTALFASVILAIIFVVSKELVLGANAVNIEASMHTLARLGGLSVFKRLDAMHTFVWILVAFIKQGALFVLAARLLNSIITKKYLVYIGLSLGFAIICLFAIKLDASILNNALNMFSFVFALACIAITRWKGKTFCEKTS